MSAETLLTEPEGRLQPERLSALDASGKFPGASLPALAFSNVAIEFGARSWGARLIARFLRRPEEARFALFNVSFVLNRGEWAVLQGVNGAGKTTILKLAQGLYEPHQGLVERFLPIAQVFGEARSFYGRLSLFENLKYFSGLQGFSSKKIESALHRVALHEFRNVPLREASTGMCARLGLARAMCAAESECVLLLDEPERGLDEAGLKLLADLLHENSNRGGSALIATHAPHAPWLEHARKFEIQNGKLVEIKSESQNRGAA